MKIITHEEAIKLVRILYFNIDDQSDIEYNNIDDIYQKTYAYIKQQETKEERAKKEQELLYKVKILLEAYDNANFHDDIDEDTMLFYKLKKELEEELK